MDEPRLGEEVYYNVTRPADQPRLAAASEPGAEPALPALAVTRLRFTAAMERPLQLPAHAGALLRSVFGAALRQGACTTGLPRCGACPLLRNCPYPAIFETPPQPTQFAQRFSQVPNPYVIEPPQGLSGAPSGGSLVFHMVLVGEAAQRQLPLVVSAWQRALRSGLGQARAPGRLVAVDAIDARGRALPAFDLVRSRADTPLSALDLATLERPAASAPPGLQLQFDTPMRLQHESQPLRPLQLIPRVFVSHLLRRINLMLDLHLGIRPAPYDVRALLALADELADNRSRLHWHDLRRYSSRQGQELPQGGVAGRWLWRGPVGPLIPWVLLGQWLHVGKGATAGLGGYRVLPLDAGASR